MFGPWWANFSPLIAMSLFIGYYFPMSKAIPLTLVSVVLSNMIINNYFYIEYFPDFSFGFNSYVLIFILISMIGYTRKNILVTSIASVLLFFLFSNFLVFTSGMYGYTWSGLIECYTFALPFLKNSLLSQLFFGLLLFGGYDLYNRKVNARVV